MTTDRELLELAAKAAGIQVLRSCLDDPSRKYLLLVELTDDNRAIGWNPLTDDGDALRLAAALDFKIFRGIRNKCVYAGTDSLSAEEAFSNHGGDKCAATRRAIVRAAAEIGKQMP